MEREDHDEDTLFALRLMNFIFNVKHVILPDELYEMLQNYEPDMPSRFSPNVTHATLILMEFEDSRRIYTDIDPLFFYSGESFDLCENFNCRDFLRFCVRYGLASLKDYLGGNMDAPFIVFNTITRIIGTTRKSGMFNEGAWVELEEYAEHVIESANGPKIEEALDSSSETEEEKLQNKMCAESEFVLRLMHFVFELYFKDLPPELRDLLREFDKEPYDYFTPTVRAAVLAQMNSQLLIARNLGVEGLEDFYKSQMMDNFTVRGFLEGCVCFSRKAVRLYHDDFQRHCPGQIYGFLAMQIAAARENGLFTTWVDMEQAAIEVVQEDKARAECEKELLCSSADDAVDHFATRNYPTLLESMPANQIECPGCKCA